MIENKQFTGIPSAQFYLFIQKLETCVRDLLDGPRQNYNVNQTYLRPGLSSIFAKLVKSKSMSW